VIQECNGDILGRVSWATP